MSDLATPPRLVRVRLGDRERSYEWRNLPTLLAHGRVPPGCEVCEAEWTGGEFRPATTVVPLRDLAHEVDAPGWDDADGPEAQTVAQALAAGTAWVTWALVAANVAVYLATVIAARSLSPGPEVLAVGWKQNDSIAAGQTWRLLSFCFLHANLIHVVLNMLALWRVGLMVEPLLGPPAFFAVYLAAGVAGAGFSYFLQPTATVGSSASVMGLLGVGWAIGLRHRRRLPRATAHDLGVPLLSWIAITLVLGRLVPNVDNWAHIGGTLLGMAAALLLDLRPLREGPRRWRRGLELGAAGLGVVALVACGWLMWSAHAPAAHMVLHDLPALGVSLRVPKVWLASKPTPEDPAVEFRAPGVPAVLRVDRLRPGVMPREGQEASWLLAASGGAKVMQPPQAIRTAAGDTAWRIVIWPQDVQEWYVWFVGDEVVRLAGVAAAERYRSYRAVFARAADSLVRADAGGAG